MAQESRLRVFRLLVQHGPSGLAAGEIAAQLEIAPATLSFHLKELAHAGLVTSRQDGRYIYYAANFSAMNELLAFLTENCCIGDCGPGASCGSPGRALGKPSSNARGARRKVKT